jgi:hypothetical protein
MASPYVWDPASAIFTPILVLLKHSKKQSCFQKFRTSQEHPLDHWLQALLPRANSRTILRQRFWLSEEEKYGMWAGYVAC